MDAAYVEKQEKNFWKLIERTKEDNETPKEQIEELDSILAIKSEEELVAFEINLRKVLKSLNKPDIIALCAILLNPLKKEGNRIKITKKPGMNGFLYFRCWLIMQGKEIVDIALKDIQKLTDTDINIADVKAEGLLYVAQAAFSQDEEDETINKAARKFDKKLSYDNEEVLPDEDVDYDNLDIKYPELVKTVFEFGD
jgi:Protein of unknown function (DUF4240)